MGNVGSSSFDLSSKAGVMHLLASVRASEISPADKNEMRDLVLAFANNSGDTSLKIEIEQKITAHNIIPVVLKSSAIAPAPEVILSFGSTRPAPSFATPDMGDRSEVPPVPKTIEASPSSVQTPSVAIVEPSVAPVPEAPRPNPTPVPPLPTVSAPVPSSSTPRLNILTPKTPLKEVSDLPRNNANNDLRDRARNDQVMRPPVRPATPSGNVTASQSNVVPPPPENIPVAVTDNSRHLERIREIKASVNNRVGNPVNLVDIDNVVGREYMSALLEAMKRISGGVAGQLEQAMTRLEEAFKNVEKVLAEHEKGSLDQEVIETEPDVPITPIVDNNVVTSTPVSPTPVITKADIPPRAPIARVERPAPVVAPTLPKVESEAEDLSLRRVAIPSRNSIPVRPVSDISSIPARPVAGRQVNHRALNIADLNEGKVEDTRSGFEDPKYQTPVSNNATTPVAPVSVAFGAVPVSQMNNAVVAPSIDKSALFNSAEETENLMAPEVDQGLDQLLTDWTLFKKSGLFGTGPKGREHPLFKKLAPLSMPLILAGRFEGSNQDIKQSITDYMNGWRYEQGIIYEQSETFENFLRRIIRHILNLQKRQRKA